MRPEDNRPLRPSMHRIQLSWTSFRKHEQTKCYVNRVEKDNERFPTWTASAPRFWLLLRGPTHMCLCKPCSCKACARIYLSLCFFFCRRCAKSIYKYKKRSTMQQPSTKKARGLDVNRSWCFSIRYKYDFVCASLRLASPRHALFKPAPPRLAVPGSVSPRRSAVPRSEPPRQQYFRTLAPRTLDFIPGHALHNKG